jgi:outer membrane lipoprotein-sorting protein
MWRATGLCLTAILLPAAALPQTRPDVTEVMKKVSEKYKNVTQYEFSMDLTTKNQDTGEPITTHFLLALKNPDKYRMEGVMPGTAGEVTTVDDGSAVWFYMARTNQYGSFPVSALKADAPGDVGDLRPEALDGFMMWRYRGASDYADSATLLRQETIDNAGAKADCFVVSVVPRGSGTYVWWIDTTSFRILREDHQGTSAAFRVIKLDEPLPDDLFRFEPPAGASKIAVGK